MGLPTELWRLIFYFAAHVSRQPTSIESLIDDWPNTGPDVMKESEYMNHPNVHSHRKATSTKFALMRVCKTSHEVVFRLLYREIRLLSVDQLDQLLVALETCTHQPAERRFGSWTKSLHVRAHHQYGFVDRLIKLISYFPNLEVFIIDQSVRTHENHDRLARQLSSLCPRLGYLKCIHYEGGYNDSGTPHYLGIISTLKYFTGGWGGNMNSTVVQNATLTTLSISFGSGDFDPGGLDKTQFLRLPSLRHLRFRTEEVDDNTRRNLLSFMTLHGPQLFSLAIDAHSAAPAFRDGVLQKCTALREYLVLNCRDEKTVWKGDPYPSVQRVGISLAFAGWQGRPAWYDMQPKTVTTALGIQVFPNLRLVTVVDVALSNLSTSEVSGFAALFTNRQGIYYEDANGFLIPAAEGRLGWKGFGVRGALGRLWNEGRS